MGFEFRHIISLGSDCDVSLQTARRGWHTTPSVFDWLITPWDAMMAVLSDEGARLSQTFTLGLDGKAAVCAAYHLIYWHEFPRDETGRVCLSQEAAARARRKLLHKMDRMRAACESGGCVLFIRAGIVTDAPGDRFANGTAFSEAELDRFVLLITALYPKLRFSLLFIDYDGRDGPIVSQNTDPRIARCSLRARSDPERGPKDTRATDEAWWSVLSQIPYRPRKGARLVEGVFVA